MDGATPAIQVSGLTKRYGSAEKGLLAVDRIDFEVDRGEVFGFLRARSSTLRECPT
ncbi:MAG: hypothetical protein ACP5HS_09595 [Anaerolineae bacterium]